jgi:hypothetical protein
MKFYEHINLLSRTHHFVLIFMYSVHKNLDCCLLGCDCVILAYLMNLLSIIEMKRAFPLTVLITI